MAPAELSEPLVLPVVRLKDYHRRLCGDVGAEPFPPAAASIPVSRSSLSLPIGRAIILLGAAVIALDIAAPAYLPHPAIYKPAAFAGLTLMFILTMLRERIEEWWVGVQTLRRVKRWPPVTLFGVMTDGPSGQGWAIVALHPHEQGEDGYTRRPVVLRNLGPAPRATAAVWHRQLVEINQRARTDTATSYELVLEQPL